MRYVGLNESARIVGTIDWGDGGDEWLFAAEDVPAFWVEDFVGFAGHFCLHRMKSYGQET